MFDPLRCHDPRGALTCGSPMPRGEQIAKPAEWEYPRGRFFDLRSEEHTSELQSQSNLVCRLLLEKKKKKKYQQRHKKQKINNKITYTTYIQIINMKQRSNANPYQTSRTNYIIYTDYTYTLNI